MLLFYQPIRKTQYKILLIFSVPAVLSHGEYLHTRSYFALGYPDDVCIGRFFAVVFEHKKCPRSSVSQAKIWWRWWEYPAVKDAFGAAVAGFAP
jgi:hypothetical protein